MSMLVYSDSEDSVEELEIKPVRPAPRTVPAKQGFQDKGGDRAKSPTSILSLNGDGGISTEKCIDVCIYIYIYIVLI